MSRHGLPDGYAHRWPVQAFNPFGADEAYQRAVYARAAMLRHEVRGLLLDVGCGSAAKLVEYFQPHEAIGTDLPGIVAHAQAQHPAHRFVALDAPWPSPLAVVLSADVIEHVEDPAALLDRLCAAAPWVILSTPAREHIRGGSLTGPPVNPCHAREWTMPEFAAFVASWLDIVEHTLIDPARATQCVVGRRRS